MTAFALTYAIGGPLLAIFTSGWPRRTVLVGGMAAFALASAPPAQRGRALAIVSGGLTIAIVAGVPLGTLLGTHLGWRATFGAVALLSAFAAVALAIGLPKSLGEGSKPVSLKARLDAARLPGVLPALVVTLLWGTGTYAVLTYLAPYLKLVADMPADGMSGVLLLGGVAAAVGLAMAGGFTVAHASPGVVGWVGGSVEVLALLLVLVIERRRAAGASVVQGRCAAW